MTANTRLRTERLELLPLPAAAAAALPDGRADAARIIGATLSPHLAGTGSPARKSADFAGAGDSDGSDVRMRVFAPTLRSKAPTGCLDRKEWIVKFMILTYGSQQDYDELAGKPSERPAWSRDDFIAMATFMGQFASELQESGELIETRGLSAPVHARRVSTREGAPVVTDGPYAESQEVLAGYWIVECDSLDRATEIAARLSSCPAPEHVRERAYADVRQIDEHVPDQEG